MHTLKHVLWNESIGFKIKVLICLLLCRSFENVIHNFVANSNGLLSVSDIKNLERYYKKRSKALVDIIFLKNCITLKFLPKFQPFSFY